MSKFELVSLQGPGERELTANFLTANSPSERGLFVLASELLPPETLQRFAQDGLHVLVLEEHSLSDREALANMESACKWMSREHGCEEIVALGAEGGGTRAFLLGCTASVLAGVAVIDGPLQIAELSRERPFQPIEMALSLSCPLLAIASEDNASITAEDRERATQVLSQFARTFDIVTRPGTGRDPASPADIDRVLSFLSEVCDS